jgi:hypothetical protein
MSKELDRLEDTLNEYVTLFDANPNPPKRSFMESIEDSLLFCILFFPLVVFIDNLKSLKDQECVHVSDAIEVWIRFLLLGGAYTAVAVAICTLLYQLSLLPTKTHITIASIILAVILIIAVPSCLITSWARKK